MQPKFIIKLPRLSHNVYLLNVKYTASQYM